MSPTTGTTISQLLAERIDGYDLGLRPPLELRSLGSRLSGGSEFHRYDVRGRDGARSILVKLGRPGRAAPAADGANARPALAPPSDPATGLRREFDVLRAIDDGIRPLGEVGLGTIEALDFIGDVDGIVMAHAEGVPLSGLLSGRMRPRRPGPVPPDEDRRLATALERTGRWLRAYHGLDLAPDQGTRLERPEELRAVAERLLEYLAARVGRTGMFERARTAIDMALPAAATDLQVAIAHGDFAARNVLVGPGARVTVLDTRARWRAPVLEDLGQMLVSIRLARRQVLTMGLAVPERLAAEWETHLLRGYFADRSPPLAGVRLFELLALLDKWAAAVQRAAARQSRWAGEAMAARLVNHAYGRRTVVLSAQLVEMAPGIG